MNNKGFTLLELIIVIVVLGVIAVTAAPKFIDFSTNARVMAMQALEDNINASVNLVRSKAIVAEQTGRSGQLQIANGAAANDFYGLVYGWPAATGGDGSNGKGFGLVQLISNNFKSPNMQLEILTEKITSIELTDRRANNKSQCRIIYQQSTNPDQPPKITAVLSGC